MSSLGIKALSFSALSAFLGFFGLFHVTALSGLSSSGLFGFIVAALISGVALTAYYGLIDSVVKPGIFGSKAAAAKQGLPISVVSTLLLLFGGTVLHLFAATGLLAGLISLAGCVAVERITESQAR